MKLVDGFPQLTRTSLLHLPSEIRFSILQHVFSDLHLQLHRNWQWRRVVLSPPPSIILVCRKLSGEALPIFLHNVHFHHNGNGDDLLTLSCHYWSCFNVRIMHLDICQLKWQYILAQTLLDRMPNLQHVEIRDDCGPPWHEIVYRRELLIDVYSAGLPVPSALVMCELTRASFRLGSKPWLETGVFDSRTGFRTSFHSKGHFANLGHNIATTWAEEQRHSIYAVSPDVHNLIAANSCFQSRSTLL